MKLKSMCSVALATACVCCSLVFGGTSAVKADTYVSGNINNGEWYQFWDNSDGPSFNQNGQGNYSVWWSNYGGDFTCGTGWSTGSWQSIGYNCGAFSMNGFGMFGIYGWFTSRGPGLPDTEYYVVEISAGSGPGGTYYGSFYTDGAWYNIYHNYFPNRTGLSGAPLEQWISVRQGNNTVGQNHVVTITHHFNAWKKLGWRIGNFNYQIVGTEGGFGSSGYVNATAWRD